MGRGMNITHELQIALYAYNAGIANARRGYERGPDLGVECETGLCTEHTACWPCRDRARNLLAAATNEEECAALLAVLDKPFNPRKDASKCGERGGWQIHYRRGEPPCEPCREARNAAQRAYTARRRGGGTANA